MTIFINFWFWFTPIVYPYKALSQPIKSLLKYNPMADLVIGYQSILLDHQWPNWNLVWPVFVLGILLVILGVHLFRKHSAEMVDEL
jgi:lipopolysaccharide transport system permease protein